MRLSIAMTTYNGERYLEAQLESFRRQTVPPDEIVVCDDQSTDRTMTVVEAFAEAAPFPVRAFRNPKRLGYTGNFERAIRECQGDIILLSDQDDVWFPTKLEVVVEAFNSAGQPLVVINDAELTDQKLRPLGLTKLGQTVSAGLGSERFITGCCTALSAAMRPLILPIPKEHFVHDAWIHAIGGVLGRRQVIGKVLQYYRRHGENASHALTSRTSRVTAGDVVRHYGPKDSRVGCAQRLARLDALALRLIEKRLEAEMLLDLSTPDVESALRHIDREQTVVRRRATLLESNRLVRPFAAWRLFRDGGYEYFSGWKSLAKDLIQ